MTPKALVLRFRGWVTVRLATEPDPPDEPWGASGYTFAFAGEPPLDRILRTQPLDDERLVRPGAPWGRGGWGVYVYDAFLLGTDGSIEPQRDFLGTKFTLRGNPRFENRSWLLTPPGFEPIVPFDLFVESPGRDPGVPGCLPPVAEPWVISRSAPLNPENTDPAWKQPLKRLLAQGAHDILIERETIGSEIGIWDPMPEFVRRMEELRRLMVAETNPERRQCLASRLYELEFAIAHPRDRRVMVRYLVERFSVVMEGRDAVVPAKGPLATLDRTKPWFADFWMGAWDFDLLAAFFKGSLQVPFRSED